MTYPPGQTLAVRNNGVGLVDTSVAPPLVVGVTSSGTAATLYDYSDPNNLRSEQGFGPAVELGLQCILAAGRVLLLKTASSTAGSNGTVTKTAVGTSTGTITVAGTPRDSYRFLGQITLTGTVGVGRFKYSLDRITNTTVYTFSEEIIIPAGGTYAVPNTGLTLTFVPGGGPTMFEAGDLHRFDSVAPHYTTADLSAAITALLAQIGNRDIRKVFFAGKNSSGANAATMAAAISTHMTTLLANDYYARAMLDAGLDTVANVKTAFASFADDRVAYVYSDADLVTLNAFAGWGVPRLPMINVAAERAAAAQLSENLGRKASGALRGVRAIYHDEGTTTSFTEADKIITARTYRRKSGFYLTNGYLRSPVGSDFLYWDWGCTIDELCATIVDAQDKWILAKLRALADGTGHLDPRDAGRLNSAVRAAIKAKLLDPTNVEGFNGHVSAVSYAASEVNDFLSTRTIQSTSSAVPLPPAETISTVVGFARSAA